MKGCSFERDGIDVLFRDFIAYCPNIAILNFGHSNVTEISTDSILQMPSKLEKMVLVRNPICTTDLGRKTLLGILCHCKMLGYIGRCFNNEGKNDLITHSKLGHIMSINRARSKVLLGQFIRPALWSTILFNAPKAFRLRLDDDDDRGGNPNNDFNLTYDGTSLVGITEQSDAIYHLLRKRVVEEMMQ